MDGPLPTHTDAAFGDSQQPEKEPTGVSRLTYLTYLQSGCHCDVTNSGRRSTLQLLLSSSSPRHPTILTIHSLSSCRSPTTNSLITTQHRERDSSEAPPQLHTTTSTVSHPSHGHPRTLPPLNHHHCHHCHSRQNVQNCHREPKWSPSLSLSLLLPVTALVSIILSLIHI